MSSTAHLSSVEQEDPEFIAVTMIALLALLSAGIKLHDVGRHLADGGDLEALGLCFTAAYRLSDGHKVWVVRERER